LTDEYLVQIEGLVVGYPDQKGMGRAVDGVDLKIKQGEAIGLVGESGCGKTTLGLTLLKLNKQGKVLAGTVRVDSTDVLSLEGESLRRYRWKTTSMIFQSAMNALNPVKTIETQMVETMRQHSKINKKDARAKAAGLLTMVNIDPSRGSSYPHELSGGMKQRVVIAMSLCLEPRLVIADEPTTALDVVVQASILRTIKRLKDELGLTVILITHDISILHGMTDRIGVMYAGKIVEIGSTSEVLGNPQHPYTQALLKAVPEIGSRSQIRGIPGALPSISNRPTGCRFNPRCPYAFEKCRAEEPDLEGEGHAVACWLVNK
jgi:peptide/nickel transport system ATP-binding protein